LLALAGCTAPPVETPKLADPEPPSPLPSAGGITLQDDTWGNSHTFFVDFPSAMVPLEVAQQEEGGPMPLKIVPPVGTGIRWNSATQARVPVTGALKPATRYRVTLAPGLKDLDGMPVAPKDWYYEFSTPPFRLESSYAGYGHMRGPERGGIGREPVVSLHFSAPVAPEELARTAHFREEASGERLPAEVELRPSQKDEPSRYLHVRPKSPLPLDRGFQLVLDGTRNAVDGAALPYPKVIELGETSYLDVEWVLALNQPFERPHILVKFKEILDQTGPDLDQIVLDPPVENVRLVTSLRELRIEGDFDTSKRYKVKLKPGIKSRRGIGMAKESVWGATFHTRRPTVAFPQRSLLSQPAAQGLNLAFIQINTGKLQWRLAELPLNKVPGVRQDIRAYRSPEEASPRVRGLNLAGPLVDVHQLKVVAEGDFPASPGDAETLRRVSWKPEANANPGLYLLEVTGKGPDGEAVGNRVIVDLAKYALVRKDVQKTSLYHVLELTTGQPVPDLPVALLDDRLNPLQQGKTDANGNVVFPRDTKRRARQVYATLGEEGQAVTQRLDMATFPIGRAPNDSEDEDEFGLTSYIFDNQGLYRPGETVHFKGITRQRTRDGLKVPALDVLKWKITHNDREVTSGEAQVSPDGGWSGEWKVPKTQRLGRYHIEAAGSDQSFSVQEYKPPLFEVTAETKDSLDGTARAVVRSHYFHGAPNTGAVVRWTAQWYPSTYDRENGVGYQLDDEFSEQSPNRGFTWSAMSQFLKTSYDHDLVTEERSESVEVEGLATLGADGSVKIDCPSPFKGTPPANRFRVYWEFAMTSPDGRTLGDAESSYVQFREIIPGISLQSRKPREVKLSLFGFGQPRASESEVMPTEVTLFRVDARTAREEISRNVFRYRNSLVFHEVWQNAVDTPEKITIPVDQPGRYVAVARGLDGGLQVSAEAFVADPAEQKSRPAFHQVNSPTTFNISTEQRIYVAGETAKLKLEAPYSGQAWVTVETDRILDQFTTELKNNAAELEIPLKPEYAPNVTVCVYLFRPGADNRLPAERMGEEDLIVQRAGQELEVKVGVHHPGSGPGSYQFQIPGVQEEVPEFRPGQEISGKVHVYSDKAAAGTEVTLFAVDESVLEYGNWYLEDMIRHFYPKRYHRVLNFRALSDLVDVLPVESLTQKGWLVGDKSLSRMIEDSSRRTMREDFRTLAFWKADLKTDSKGMVAYKFNAPESLTAYRIVAVAHNRKNQFGHGQALVRVNKPLQAEPSLPRFVRCGDEVELRLIVRQLEKESAEVKVDCEPGPGIILTGDPSQTVTVQKGVPRVVRFPAKVGEAVGKPKVAFFVKEVKAPENEDAVAVELPVLPPSIMLKRAEAGAIAQGGLNLPATMPEAWRQARGEGDVIISSSPWLPQLAGLPEVLDYPYGCTEQISSRILAYTLLRDLLNELPVPEKQLQEYEEMVFAGFRGFEDAQLSSGAFAYWQGTDKPNLFATVQATWAMLSGKRAGLAVEGPLLERALNACERIVRREQGWTAEPYTRAFALMVLAESGREFPVTAEARELYLNRDGMGDDGRAMLVLACHRLGIMPEEQKELLGEIKPSEDEKGAFDPRNFGSATRTEALVYLARLRVEGASWSARQKQDAFKNFAGSLESASLLSTQENLWLLLAFHGMMRSEPAVRIGQNGLPSPPDVVAASGSAFAWENVPLDQWKERFGQTLDPAQASSYLLRASYWGPREQGRENHGMALRRTLTNLTDATRTGSAGKALRIGDEVLITYTINSEHRQYYVALDDELPGCLEAVNPAIAAEATAYRLPDGVQNTLFLSNAERRDARTTLFFDRLPESNQTYSILARVVAGGSFRWPASQIAPMYDARVSGVSASNQLHADGQLR